MKQRKKGECSRNPPSALSPIDCQANPTQRALLFQTLFILKFLQFNLLRKSIVPHNSPHLVDIGERIKIFIVMIIKRTL